METQVIDSRRKILVGIFNKKRFTSYFLVSHLLSVGLFSRSVAIDAISFIPRFHL